jgi:hypothetical protein
MNSSDKHLLQRWVWEVIMSRLRSPLKEIRLCAAKNGLIMECQGLVCVDVQPADNL